MAPVSKQIRVLIVDDDALVRAGLAMLLAGAEGIAVVGEVADGSHVAQAVAEHEPDILLMDIRMPGMDGLAATELVRAQSDAPEVIDATCCSRLASSAIRSSGSARSSRTTATTSPSHSRAWARSA